MNPNIKTALILLCLSLGMFGFGYAMVPLYDVFCDAVGLNGKTGEISKADAENTERDTARLITVEFDTNVNSQLNWRFRPEQRKMVVHPGEINEALFYAENLSDRTIIGQAIPSVAPFEASVFFNKTECFCFTEQSLGPRESREMPVRFIVDPSLPGKYQFMTLSYTFFLSPSNKLAAAPGNES